MRIRVLGPVRVWDGTAWQWLGAAQTRVVLGVLVAEMGRPVSTDRLVDEVWGDTPPSSARTTLHKHIWRLRRQLGAAAVATLEHGYELSVAEHDVDALVFEGLVASGRRALGDDDMAGAAEQLGEALALWHGPALADVPASPAVAGLANRLEQVRLDAAEDLLDARLRAGRHTEVLDDLARLVAEHPLRERLRALLMLALYRSGRRADALTAYQAARRCLVEELGVEPGPDLMEMQRAILKGSAELARGLATPKPMPRRVVPAQLPAEAAGFTGRTAALKQLDALSRPEDDQHDVAVVAITGPAGVGKTALALHWARRAAGSFPDGQLFVNLRGCAVGQPLRTVEALAAFLRGLGVPDERIPADPEQAAALYRSSLAGKRILVVLDNAREPDQVRPLLPGTAGCLALVTSRDRLAGLVARDGAVPVSLDVLADDEARALLSRILSADRLRAQPQSATTLARLCGNLPLALRIAAANLAVRPHATISGYAGQLRADRLGGLELDGDPEDGVRAAFRLSYVALPEPAQRLFRLLGTVPGPDVTLPAAVALAGTETEPTRDQLGQLVAAHLLDEHAPGRHAMHDLLRQYATEQTTPEEANAALDRLYDYYLDHAAAAADLLYPQMRRLPGTMPVTAARFAAEAEALAWLDAELPNLVAAVRHSTAHGPHPVAWRLADALRGYFARTMSTLDSGVVAEASLAAAAAGNTHGAGPNPSELRHVAVSPRPAR